MPLLGFPVFCLSSSIVLNRYFHILVNSMISTEFPKLAWPNPLKSVLIPVHREFQSSLVPLFRNESKCEIM